MHLIFLLRVIFSVIIECSVVEFFSQKFPCMNNMVYLPEKSLYYNNLLAQLDICRFRRINCDSEWEARKNSQSLNTPYSQPNFILALYGILYRLREILLSQLFYPIKIFIYTARVGLSSHSESRLIAVILRSVADINIDRKILLSDDTNNFKIS